MLFSVAAWRLCCPSSFHGSCSQFRLCTMSSATCWLVTHLHPVAWRMNHIRAGCTWSIMHILQQPRYASKYPPMQGLFLAVGQLVTSRPLAGVWLSAATAAATICWMLQGWMPRRWGMLGGVVSVLHARIAARLGTVVYMGGPPAVIGSALSLWCSATLAKKSIMGEQHCSGCRTRDSGQQSTV